MIFNFLYAIMTTIKPNDLKADAHTLFIPSHYFNIIR